MTTFEAIIYQDALGLLIGDKPDIKAEILGQIKQGDPCMDGIADELRDIAEEKGYDADKVQSVYEKDTCEHLMEYVAYTEAGISFDYSESAAAGDLRVLAYRVPCTFAAEKYIKDVL